MFPFLPVKTYAQQKELIVSIIVTRKKINYKTNYYLKVIDYKADYYWETIDYYCSLYGCNTQQLYRVMMCESSGNPLAYNNSGASGLFQFMPSTWRYFSNLSGIYGDIWNTEDQIHLAAWAFANGLSYHWVCK